MPLFKRYPRNKEDTEEALTGLNQQPAVPPIEPRTKLVFHCQQAQGSPMGIIKGFTNINELYQRISECYDFPPEDVSIACQLPTLKIQIEDISTDIEPESSNFSVIFEKLR